MQHMFTMRLLQKTLKKKIKNKNNVQFSYP